MLARNRYPRACRRETSPPTHHHPPIHPLAGLPVYCRVRHWLRASQAASAPHSARSCSQKKSIASPDCLIIFYFLLSSAFFLPSAYVFFACRNAFSASGSFPHTRVLFFCAALPPSAVSRRNACSSKKKRGGGEEAPRHLGYLSGYADTLQLSSPPVCVGEIMKGGRGGEKGRGN